MGPVTDTLARVRRVVTQELKPRVVGIDQEGVYPEPVLRSLGEAGLFGLPIDAAEGDGLAAGIRGLALVGEHCTSTAFLCWCQMVCAWYLHHSPNRELRARLLPAVAAGKALAGTALSNPMKACAGLEPIRLHGRRVPGGYDVTGHVAFASNMGPGHWFAGVFEVAHETSPVAAAPRRVMAMFQCGEMDGLDGGQTAHFCAMEGTRTFTLTLRLVFVPEERVLADPVEPYLLRIVPGFVLLQTGIALGLVRDCLDIIRSADRTRRDVNRLLPDGHDRLASELATVDATVERLTSAPLATDATLMRRVLQARLDSAELALRAAQAAMLHAGAAGFVRTARAQRRLREAQFVALLTPSVRHLRWELDAIAGGGGTMSRLKAGVP